MTGPLAGVEPVPMNYGNPGCPAMVRRDEGQWARCELGPTHAGYLGGREIHRVFPCPVHLHLVDRPAPMTDEDRAELDGRREQHVRALAGLPYERVGPLDPLDLER